MAFNMKGSPMHRNFGIGSPAKQKKDSDEGTVVYEGRENEKGQSQKDILEMRAKNINDYDTKVSKFANEKGELDLSEEQYEGYKKNRQGLLDKLTHSTDSINKVNKNINLRLKREEEEENNKRNKAAESGLFD